MFSVAAWRDTPYFSEKERAALALTEALTRLSDRADPVPDAIWGEADKQFGEQELAALILAIANIPRAIHLGKPFYAFLSSSSTIAAFTFLFGATLSWSVFARSLLAGVPGRIGARRPLRLLLGRHAPCVSEGAEEAVGDFQVNNQRVLLCCGHLPLVGSTGSL